LVGTERLELSTYGLREEKIRKISIKSTSYM